MGGRLFPVASLCEVELSFGNALLERWGHRMGGLRRGNQGGLCHVLFEGGEAVAVTTTSPLIGLRVGGVDWLTSEVCVELSRLAAARPGLCRLMLRAWREFVFPLQGRRWAVSYQDAVLHSGDTYRFDGWRRVGYSHSGTDRRTGRPGRDKWVWVWPPPGDGELQG